MIAATRVTQARHISVLPIDEWFNIAKNLCGQGSSTRMNPTRVMAHAIDKGLLSKLNHFDEVDLSTTVLAKGLSRHCGGNVFSAPLRRSHLDDDLSALKLHEIVGTGEARWYSPKADAMHKNLAQMLACRDCYDAGDVSSVQFTWLSRLCNGHMLIRKAGTFTWSLCIGNVMATSVVVWPVEDYHGQWTPKSGQEDHSQWVTITNLEQWEALPIQPISPMHKAVKMEQGRAAALDKSISLKHSRFYPAIPIVAKATDIARSLLQCVCIYIYIYILIYIYIY